MTKTIDLQETGGKPAPGELALVQAFVNTNDVEAGRDKLSSPEGLRSWLLDHDLLEGESVSAGDVEQALELREALRALLLANNGLPAHPEPVATLNRISAEKALVVQLNGANQARLKASSGGVDGALAHLLGIVYTAMAEGTWPRLKACRNDACHWAFFDHSKNRSGTWCTMAVCGSRIKVRNYRRRQRAS